MCGAAMLRLWKRSQSAAQYVSNVLDSGNQRLKPLLDSMTADQSQMSAPPAPAPAPGPEKDPAEAFWLSGHEVRDLLTIKLAVPLDSDATTAGGGRRVSSGQAPIGAGMKRKVGGTAAYGGGKRRRSDEDLPSDLSEKNQKYLAQMLIYISVGEDCDLPSSGGPMGVAASQVEQKVKWDSTAEAAHAPGLAQPSSDAAANRDAGDANAAQTAHDGEPDAAKTSRRAGRDRWTHVRSSSSSSITPPILPHDVPCFFRRMLSF